MPTTLETLGNKQAGRYRNRLGLKIRDGKNYLGKKVNNIKTNIVNSYNHLKTKMKEQANRAKGFLHNPGVRKNDRLQAHEMLRKNMRNPIAVLPQTRMDAQNAYQLSVRQDDNQYHSMI